LGVEKNQNFFGKVPLSGNEFLKKRIFTIYQLWDLPTVGGSFRKAECETQGRGAHRAPDRTRPEGNGRGELPLGGTKQEEALSLVPGPWGE